MTDIWTTLKVEADACRDMHEVQRAKIYERAAEEIKKLRREVERAMNDDLDWNRLHSGDNRALNPEHQDVFDMVADYVLENEQLSDEIGVQQDEISRLRWAIDAVAKDRDGKKDEIEHLYERIANARDALNDDDINGAALILYMERS